MKINSIFWQILMWLLIVPGLTLHSQSSDPPYLKYTDHPWVDSVMKSLTVEEKIGQLIWIAAFANRDIGYDVNISNVVEKNGIGGIIFFQGNAPRQAQMINHFREISKVPPLIAIDGEWGVGMRLEEIPGFPFQMTLGAVKNDSLIYTMGKYIADQMKRSGVDINLAPVADVNNNPKNPVINARSFGEDPESVSRKTVAYMKGMQDNGIIAVAKHFPGHGDTEVDSHLDLPVIKHSLERLQSVELVPFRSLINSGIGAVMPGHIWVPALDPVSNIPATISQPVLTGLLRNDMRFRGLILSDAMNMGGITKYTKPGESEVLALAAGMDVLEYVTDPGRAIESIMTALENGKLTMSSIDERCRRVLASKFWAGLSSPVPVNAEGITEELFTPAMKSFTRELYASALTLLENRDNIIPIRRVESLKIASLGINTKEISLFQQSLGKYTRIDHYTIDINGGEGYRRILEKLEEYDLVIAGVYGIGQRTGRGPGINSGLDSLVRKLNRQNQTLITWFGNPYSIDRVPGVQEASALLLTYQLNDYTESLAAQLIFGGFGAHGTLPVTINEKYPAGHGIKTAGNLRLQFGFPESAGMSSVILEKKIDSLALLGIAEGAYPGCIVMAARKGVVVFSKSYGHHEYDGRIEVREDDIYDLASVTKISAATPGLMLLDSQGRFTPDEYLGNYVPLFKGSNKEKIVIRDMLTHQSGLVSWIPFWRETIRESTGQFRNRTFQTGLSDRFPLIVADNMYIHRTYRNRLFREIRNSNLGEKRYVYSDLAFIIAPEIIASITGEDWTDFIMTNIYHKLGAFDITFNPYLKYPLSRIVPTEYDTLFRRQLIHGYVHDEGAAMLGGASGHAGLFATAGDLMKLMEMYRRMGSYGGEQIISEEVMKEYTRYQFPDTVDNRRGLCFDKPKPDNHELPPEEVYPALSASPSSFGHSGFTGTFTWIDPEYEITYVFLSNRVYPTRNNSKLSDLNIRTEILQALYDSIIDIPSGL
ncbi:MAG: glycoside hydrolase family 3 N-terminal domain-containing protein [Bacteroidales bacterium]